VHGLGGCVHITVETPAGCDMRDEVFRLFAGADIPIVEMTTNDISLEDVFLRLTEDKTVLDISENTEDTEKPEESEESVSSDMSEETEEVEEADEAEDTDSPYYTKKSKKKDKKNSGDEEYTPLFGGKE